MIESTTALRNLLPACVAALRSGQAAGRDELLVELVDALIFEACNEAIAIGAVSHQ